MSNGNIEHDDKLNQSSPIVEEQKAQSVPIKCDKTMLEKLQEQMNSNQIK